MCMFFLSGTRDHRRARRQGSQAVSAQGLDSRELDWLRNWYVGGRSISTSNSSARAAGAKQMMVLSQPLLPLKGSVGLVMVIV